MAWSDIGYAYYKCPVCKKQFNTYGTQGWVYKYRYQRKRAVVILTFCGYTCMQTAKQLIEHKPRRDARK